MSDTEIIVFAKAPVAGRAKTRLIPALGAAGAATLAARLLSRTLDECLAAEAARVTLACTPEISNTDWHSIDIPGEIAVEPQPHGTLGDRLLALSERALGRHRKALLIGSDCPALDRHELNGAIDALDAHDVVMQPARDGGYVLLGLKSADPVLFADIPWSTAGVAAATEARCTSQGYQLGKRPTLQDIDEPSDLVAVPAAILPASVA